MKAIATAFVKAKRAFGPALKDKTNPAFRSKYADLGACIDAVEDALLQNGIAAYHESTEDAAGITVECILLHESGETIKGGKLHVPAVKHDPQGFGSAMTYARRYSLMAVCGIAPEDDDANSAVKATKAASASKAAVSLVPVLEASIANEKAKRTGVMADVLATLPALSKEDAAWFDEFAAQADAMFRTQGRAAVFELVESQKFDNDQKTYFWARVKSDVRSALKVERDLRIGAG